MKKIQVLLFCQKTIQTCSYVHPVTNLICDICFNPCESCLCWQHGTCMGLYEDNVPHNYICYYCRQTATNRLLRQQRALLPEARSIVGKSRGQGQSNGCSKAGTRH
uniref:Zinc finger PHD-type domain-containing protein n=1 Tax=Amphiprion ocellaris TaxID=80972 RepID=A0AAQ6A8Q8_AMPOC